MSTIANLRSMQRMGIFADRNARSADLQFRRYNLIYGFNGSGKSTLSRLFSSLEAGAATARLPEGCAFEVTLSDGTSYSCPANMQGLEHRVLVFNSDYVERNLQWTAGFAHPVFFIGVNQAEAAAKLAALEAKIGQQTQDKTAAETTQKAADKVFANFKRERAKVTAGRLHLGNRKYEAPALTKDFESWKDDGAALLADADLAAAEEIRRRDEPLPKVDALEFDSASVGAGFKFITEICSQSMSMVALEEVQRFPDMLLWLKQGHEFHEAQVLDDCLFCGNPISSERKAELATAFDSQVDQFVTRLARTAERLQSVLDTLVQFREKLPRSDALVAELRAEYEVGRATLEGQVTRTRDHLVVLRDVLAQKCERPATPADMSDVAPQSEVEAAAGALGDALTAMNGVIEKHNAAVGGFAKHKEDAEVLIRKHFLAECRADFASNEAELAQAETALVKATEALAASTVEADQLRQQIKEHGPAAEAINKLVGSYLGHNELSVHPVDEGYQLRRHGRPIEGTPSEGEKTAIAIAYFLSSLEAEGRKLKDLIVVVDDPVSSLDTKALNFACALVRNRLENAGQVFVLTHNLQCMNEFRKAWIQRAKPRDPDKEPTGTFLFLDVSVPEGEAKRSAQITEMPRLLREYDSEYHFLFSHVHAFVAQPEAYYDHSYMMPNVLRRVLDVFLAFKCPGGGGLSNQIRKLCADYEGLDADRLNALERLAQVESHSDNLDDLLSFSSMTIEESRQAATVLIEVIEHVDAKHLAALRHLCR